MVAIQPAGSTGVVVAGVTIMGAGYMAANVLGSLLGPSGIANTDQGIALAVITAAQQVGGGLGLALLITTGTLRTNTIEASAGHTIPAAIVAGYQAALAPGALLWLAGAILVPAIMRSNR